MGRKQTASLFQRDVSSQPLCKPRQALQPLRLELADRVGVLQREPDVVEAVEQAVLAKRLHFERQVAAVGLDDDLPFRSIVNR